MTSEGLGEMFEGDSADMCAVKFLLESMGGRAEGLACVDPGARTPIGASGNFQVVINHLPPGRCALDQNNLQTVYIFLINCY